MNLHKNTILRVSTRLTTFKARTFGAILADMDTFTAAVKTQPFNETFRMVMRAEHQNVTVIIYTVAMKYHASPRHATVKQSIPTLLSHNRLRQIAVSKSNRHRNVFHLAETTLAPLNQATIYASSPTDRPTANETHWTRGLVTPQMVMTDNHLTRTIHATYGNAVMPFDVLANRETNP
jgi:hypothetical protein